MGNLWFENQEEVNVEYTFSYSIDILSNDIVFVSAPEDTIKT